MACSGHTVLSPPMLKTAGKAVWKPPLWCLEETVTFQQALYEKLPLTRGEEKQGRGPDVEWGWWGGEHQGLVFKASGESSETSFARTAFLPILRPYLLYIPILPVELSGVVFSNLVVPLNPCTTFPSPSNWRYKRQRLQDAIRTIYWKLW